MGILLEKLAFIFLHGFLGLPKDWDQIASNVKKEFPTSQVAALDYFNISELNSENKFSVWCKNFENYLAVNFKDSRIILVGYSLGGRLALNFMKNYSARIQHLFLVSVNPGFLETEIIERKQRLAMDEKWSQRFLHEDWKLVLEDWNKQAVFANSKAEPLRESKNFDRQLLAKALTNWSLAGQDDLRSILKGNQNKISWIVGESDKKYVLLTEKLSEMNPKINYRICSNSSHRVLFDNPTELSRFIVGSV